MTLTYTREIALSSWSLHQGLMHELTHLILSDNGLPIMGWKSELMASTLDRAPLKFKWPWYESHIESLRGARIPQWKEWFPKLKGMGIRFPAGTRTLWFAFVGFLFKTERAGHFGDVLAWLKKIERGRQSGKRVKHEFQAWITLLPGNRPYSFWKIFFFVLMCIGIVGGIIAGIMAAQN